jgi:hypothetical protein
MPNFGLETGPAPGGIYPRQSAQRPLLTSPTVFQNNVPKKNENIEGYS